MAELVDASVLGTDVFGRGNSIFPICTTVQPSKLTVDYWDNVKTTLTVNSEVMGIYNLAVFVSIE